MEDGRCPEDHVRLVIDLDPDDVRWTHFTTPRSLVLSFQDLPHPLQNKLRSVLNNLRQRSIVRLDFDSQRNNPAHVRAATDSAFHPFDLGLLREEESFRNLFGLVVWWIDRVHKYSICREDINGKRPHSTWLCECGARVTAEKELCDNEMCPTWLKYAACTGKKMLHLRLARSS